MILKRYICTMRYIFQISIRQFELVMPIYLGTFLGHGFKKNACSIVIEYCK